MWMLDKDIAAKIDNAVSEGFKPSASQIAAVSMGGDMAIAGDIAQINIRGVLTVAPDFFAAIFGGGNTVYGDIIQAVRAADSDPDISEIVLSVDSPGGSVAGMLDTMSAIAETKTPIKAIIENTAASAAYGLVSQADTIVAVNKMSIVGSVGTTVSFRVDEDVVNITNTESPNKRPDVSTHEGQAVIREQLDSMYQVFVDVVAEGRGKSVDFINTNFGKGSMIVAEEAIDRGMIDSIQAVSSDDGTVVAQAVESTQTLEDISMDITKLKAEHPAVYQAAVDEGIAVENDRVSAHLTLGKASGDMETAIEAVENGDELTAKLQARYMAAGMNRNDVDARVADDGGADAGSPDAAAPISDEDKLGAETLAIVEEAMGVEHVS